MGAERIVFGHAAPVRVYHALAVFFGADSVFPVIFVCKKTARPAEIWNVQFFKSLDDSLVVTVNVRNV